MNHSLFFTAFGAGLVLLACTSAPTNEQTGEDDLSKAKAACAGKACGEPCRLCPPGAANCFETLELKQCNAKGRCSPAPAECALDGGPAPDPDPIDAGPGPDPDPIDGGPAPYEPCAGLSCGAPCSVCSPSDPDCVETAVLKFCHANGACLATTPTCAPPPPYEPCAGKTCGDACTICDPADPNCFETAVLKACDALGQCSPGATTCPAS